jgi:hypothetical protein
VPPHDQLLAPAPAGPYLLQHALVALQHVKAHARDLLLGPQPHQQVQLKPAALLAAVQHLVDELRAAVAARSACLEALERWVALAWYM